MFSGTISTRANANSKCVLKLFLLKVSIVLQTCIRDGILGATQKRLISPYYPLQLTSMLPKWRSGRNNC